MSELIRTAHGIEVKFDSAQFKTGNEGELELAATHDPSETGLIVLPNGKQAVGVDIFGGLEIGADGLRIATPTPRPVTMYMLTPIVGSTYGLDISDGEWHTLGHVIANEVQNAGFTPVRGNNWLTILPKLTLAVEATGADRLMSIRLTKDAGENRWSFTVADINVNNSAPDGMFLVRELNIYDPLNEGQPFSYDGEAPDGHLLIEVQLQNPGNLTLYPSHVTWEFSGND